MAETTALTTHISQADLQELERLYTFRGRDEVLEFINDNSFLIPVLLEAPQIIQKYFGDARLRLEISVDPEILNYIHLMLFVVTGLQLDEALDKLHQFDVAWDLKASERVQEKLIIDTRYS